MATKQSGAQDIRRPDAQGRINIGKENSDQPYLIERLSNGDILLQPVVVLHKREAWLFSNREALESVRRGINESASGKLHDLGSFAEHASEDSEQDEE